MPCILTTVHDPLALAATCQRVGLRPPQEGTIYLDGKEASGWIVRLPGLHAPLVFNTLTGLVAYHPKDNAITPYAGVMRFVLRYYDVRAALLRGHDHAGDKTKVRPSRQCLSAEEVA